MKIQKEKLLRFLLYVLFGIACFLFFFYLTFPVDLAGKYVLRLFERESGCVVTVDEGEYHLPARIAWRGIKAVCPKHRLGLSGADTVDIHLKTLELRFAPLPLLLHQRAEIDFKIGSALGEVPGHLTVVEKEEQLSFSLRTTKATLTFVDEGLSGLLSIEGESAWMDQEYLKGTGKIVFTVDSGRFKEFAGWVLPMGEIAFSNIDGQFFWKDGRMVVSEFSAKGETVDVQSESGTILFRNPPDNSLLTLALSATPKGPLKEMAGLFIQGYDGRSPVQIRVTGSVRSPQLSLNGKAVRLGL